MFDNLPSKRENHAIYLTKLRKNITSKQRVLVNKLRTRNAACVFGFTNSTNMLDCGNRSVSFRIINANKYLSS
jgi:hypothetical protein